VTINAFNITLGGGTGDEATYVDATLRGLTIGGWFYFANAPGALEYLIARWNPGVSQSYRLTRLAAGTIQGSVDDGGGANNVTTTATVGATTWTWIVLRFDPSATLDLFVNRVMTSAAVPAVATIDDTTLDFTIGADSIGGNLFEGRASMPFVCVSALPDVTINSLFDRTKAAYNVS